MTDWTHGAATVSTSASGALTTYRYTPVTHKATKRGPCPECGKTNTRARTFNATINPLNKDPETGEPRTYAEVLDTLKAKEPGWTPDFTCTRHAEESETAIPTARPTDPDVTARVLTGLRTAADFAEAHGLPLCPGIEVTDSIHRLNPETRRHDVLAAPGVALTVRGSRELHAWAVALDVDTVDVYRGQDTTLTIHADAAGLAWAVRAYYGAFLGVRDPVDWNIDRRGKRTDGGYMTVAALGALPERDWTPKPTDL